MDLSFDMVKKENFEAEAEMKNVVKTENCDLRVKSENMRSDTTPSSKLQLGGGRLKFYKGQSNLIYNRNGHDRTKIRMKMGFSSICFSIHCSCGLSALVWKMFVKKRELGRREEEREGGFMQMRLALEKGLAAQKPLLCPHYCAIVATNPPYSGSNGQCAL